MKKAKAIVMTALFVAANLYAIITSGEALLELVGGSDEDEE